MYFVTTMRCCCLDNLTAKEVFEYFGKQTCEKNFVAKFFGDW